MTEMRVPSRGGGRRCRFAVAELVNRLYLTGLISFFGVPREPTTTTQTSLGLLGAILYYVVLSSSDPFVDRSDDILAKVAAAQVILTFYFAAVPGGKRAGRVDVDGPDFDRRVEWRITSPIFARGSLPRDRFAG